MTSPNGWLPAFEAELEHGYKARSLGNEGQARVCARRAAGLVLREYVSLHNSSPPGTGAYDLLRHASQIPGIPAEALAIIDHFLVRINTDHQLPIQADLLEDARQLAQLLLPAPFGDT